MLTKLLLTLAVIIMAILLLASQRPKQASATSVDFPPMQSLWRRYGMRGAFLLLGLSLLSYSVWYWYDQHKVVTVMIVSPAGVLSGVYKARKGDISEAKMVTVEGVHIRFSNAERLEILED
ncbi:hypothetical protein [Shewanella mangrovisoli]|uniref:hypothetical protein n=1 Tax=Shewanella mangrovisoli TaxID=2864211 RepID=UPI001C656E6F|nr:hypothetical protein [Shewanella mangrovisoli]QYK10765.1 hypothetical protein K0H60_08920 [Shewanella mangrovisoli]